MVDNHTGIEKYDALIDTVTSPFMDDERFTGMALVGSVATGDFTPYSDFDILLLHKKEHEDEIKNELPEIAKSLSDFIIGDYYELDKKDTYWFCLTKDLVHVDWFRFNPDTLKPKHYFSSMIILKDDGTLSDIKARSMEMPEVEELSTEELIKMLLYLRTDFIYAIMKFRKGERAEGFENVKWMFKQLIQFKYGLAGKNIWDYRKYETILTMEELENWKTITMLEPTASDLEKGLMINWKNMKEIDRFYTEKFNKVLYEEFDALMWARIEKLLQEARD
ncbi:MAG: nucleotidyltransferase domain-containing protein [Thermoplasmata archaeon]|nr:nucleotidyltransferase domain-containing protein [Thermoplasmata archaeon]